MSIADILVAVICGGIILATLVGLNLDKIRERSGCLVILPRRKSGL